MKCAKDVYSRNVNVFVCQHEGCRAGLAPFYMDLLTRGTLATITNMVKHISNPILNTCCTIELAKVTMKYVMQSGTRIDATDPFVGDQTNFLQLMNHIVESVALLVANGAVAANGAAAEASEGGSGRPAAAPGPRPRLTRRRQTAAAAGRTVSWMSMRGRVRGRGRGRVQKG